MGGCLNQKQLKNTHKNSQAEYHQQQQLYNGAIMPLSTTLFNTLRKPNQLQIIQDGTYPGQLFFRQSTPNLLALEPKDLKMLYSFKNLLFVGKCDPIIQQIRTNSNPKAYYVIERDFAVKFLDKFPIFRTGQPIYQPKLIPIFVFNSSQLLKSGPKKQIFLHSEQNKNQALYRRLNIQNILTDQENLMLTNQQIGQKLQQIQQQRVLYLHSKQKKPQDFLQILSYFIMKEYGISQLGAKFYLRRAFPHVDIGSQSLVESQMIINQPKNSKKSIEGKTKQEMTLTQIFYKYLKQLYIQMGQNKQAQSKLQRAYNLLVTLISNIYNNKNSQNYRQIRKTNSQIYQLLSKYKNGTKLLNQIGFIDDGSGYVNKTDVKYLKIYRTDLDMGYRDFVNQLKGLGAQNNY